MATKIQLRRDTKSDWSAINPVLLEGEVGIEIDVKPFKFKIGDGIAAWSDLPYNDNGGQSQNNILSFRDSFGISAINTNGSIIPNGTFVYLAARNRIDGYEMISITKNSLYDGEPIGYVRNAVNQGDYGFVELITIIQTDLSVPRKGEDAYIGFTSSDPNNNFVKISNLANLSIFFGRCGKFGEIGENASRVVAYDYSILQTEMAVRRGDFSSELIRGKLEALTGDSRLDASHIKNIPNSGSGSETGSTIVTKLQGLGGNDRLDISAIKNIDPATDTKVIANTNEIARIKTVIGDVSQIYQFRGNTMPTIDNTIYKAYYISLYSLATAGQILNLPITPTPLADGTVFFVDNNDAKDNVNIRPRVGETIDGRSNYLLGANSVIFLVKKGTNWMNAFSGYMPESLSRMIADIKSALPNSLNTIDEIQAQLKDRLHTFREIQNEFTDQLHTFDAIEANMIGRGFTKSGAVTYGLSDQPQVPTGNAWIIGHMNPNEEILIPPKGGQKYVVLVVPTQLDSIVQTMKINGSDVASTKFDYIQNELKYKMLISSQAIDSSVAIRLEVIYTSEFNGITVDDGITQSAGVKSIILQNGKIGTYADDPSKIDITTSVLFKQETGQDLKATSILTQLPLRAINNPALVGNVVLDIVPGTYEDAKDDSYLACLSSNIEISPSKLDSSGEMIPAMIWFDDVQSPNGSYINLDAPTKAFSIEETDNLDPNLTNGEKYFVGVYILIEGNAQTECVVDLFLRDRETGEVVVDANKNPCLVSAHYKIGDQFWFMSLNMLILAKGQQNIQICMTHNHNTPLLIYGISYGLSSFLVQQMRKGEISNAFLQYEGNTDHDIRIGKLDLDLLEDTTYEFSKPSLEEIVNANTKIIMPDGFYLFANSAIKKKIENGNLIAVARDVSTPVLFEVGWILDTVIVNALRNKSIHTDHIITIPTVDMNIGMYQWTATGNPIYPIIASMDSATGTYTITAGWNEIATSNLNANVAKQHDTTTFNIPNNSYVTAFIIFPARKEARFEMALQKWAIQVDAPFIDYVVVGIENSAQKHFKYDDSFAKFKMLQWKPLNWTRYTINLADTKMPVGVKKLGLAPIRNTKAWTDSGFEGEGAIQFDKDGLATITTKLQIGIGEGVASNNLKEEFVKFWYSKANADKTFTKIDESETMFQLTTGQSYPKFYTMKTFKYDAKKDEVLWLFAKTTNVDDGAFIYSPQGVNAPLVETDIYFRETIPVSNDPAVNEVKFVDANGQELFDRQLQYNVDTGRMTVINVGGVI